MSLSNILGSILFGGIGFAAFMYGKKMSSFKLMIIGGLLVIYPYLIPGTVALYVIGVVLTVSLYFFRD